MSDHTPVLFNVFEDWNEESVVPQISFDSIRTQTADSQVSGIRIELANSGRGLALTARGRCACYN